MIFTETLHIAWFNWPLIVWFEFENVLKWQWGGSKVEVISSVICRHATMERCLVQAWIVMLMSVLPTCPQLRALRKFSPWTWINLLSPRTIKKDSAIFVFSTNILLLGCFLNIEKSDIVCLTIGRTLSLVFKGYMIQEKKRRRIKDRETYQKCHSHVIHTFFKSDFRMQWHTATAYIQWLPNMDIFFSQFGAERCILTCQWSFTRCFSHTRLASGMFDNFHFLCFFSWLSP